MKSLHVSKRSPRILLVSACFICLLVAPAVFMAAQEKTAYADTISQFLTEQTTQQKPAVTSGVVQQPVVQPVIVAQSSANKSSGVAVKQVAALQSLQVASKVAYPSERITAPVRDQFLLVASSLGLIGVSLYAMTLLGPAAPSAAPVTRRRPLYNAMENR